MTTVVPTVERSSPKMILVIALLVAVFAAAIIDIVTPITLIDIANTFGILPGTASQLGAFNRIAAVITALLLGAFAFKFRYKTLVVIGILFIALCSIGLFFAPTFQLAQLIYPLNGIGSVMIVVTAQTFIGQSYPLNKKAKAIGWVAAAGTLANAVGAPIVGYMADIVNWHSIFLWFMFPVAVASLIFVFIVFPFNLPEPQLSIKKAPFMSGFKQVLTNKSAVACLVSAFLVNASVFGGMVFEVTFYRQLFSASPSFAALIGPTAGTAFISLGAIVGGQIVNRVGRKRQTVITVFSAGILTLLSYFVPGLWTRVALRWTASILGGAGVAASINLMLEQVPKFRGTAMSLSSAFRGVGAAIGIAVGGEVLNFYVDPSIGFPALGLTMVTFAVGAVLVYLFFAKDPFKTQLQSMQQH